MSDTSSSKFERGGDFSGNRCAAEGVGRCVLVWGTSDGRDWWDTGAGAGKNGQRKEEHGEDGEDKVLHFR